MVKHGETSTPNVAHYQVTWDEHLDRVERGRKADRPHKISRSEGDWYGPGIKSVEDARKLEQGGYHATQAAADKIKRHVEDTVFTHSAFQVGFQAVWDVAGAEVDVGTYLAGIPECMVEAQPVRIAKAGRAVQLVIPICNSGSVDSDVMVRRGAAVLALIDCLLLAQHPVDVWAIHAVERDGGRWCEAIHVQRADQPLNEGRIHYVFGHPASLRVTGFNSQDSEPDAIRRQFGFREGGGYGSPSFAARASDVPPLEGTVIVLDSLQSSRGWSEEESVAWVEEQLRLIFGE